jgi:hypothetical protein
MSSISTVATRSYIKAACFSAGLAVSLLVASPALAQSNYGLVPIVPCRMMDTRISNAAYPSPYGGGPFTPLSKRTITVAGSIAPGNPCSGVIPGGDIVVALAVNFTVVNPNSQGDLREVPGGDPGGNFPTSLMNYSPGIFAIANSVSIPVVLDQITLQEVGATANVLMDVEGYYTSQLSNAGGSVVTGINTSNGEGVTGFSAGGVGTLGISQATDGVLGETEGTDATNSGVHGKAGNGYGVFGESSGTGEGVHGETQTGVGVHGKSLANQGGIGVLAEAQGPGTEALRVTNGAIRINGAAPAAFKVFAQIGGPNNNTCRPTGSALWVLVQSSYSNLDPNALVFAIADNSSSTYGVAYLSSGYPCGNGQWGVFHTDSSDVGEGERLNVLIVKTN